MIIVFKLYIDVMKEIIFLERIKIQRSSCNLFSNTVIDKIDKSNKKVLLETLMLYIYMLTKERRKSNMNVKERRVEEYNGGGIIIKI